MPDGVRDNLEVYVPESLQVLDRHHGLPDEQVLRLPGASIDAILDALPGSRKSGSMAKQSQVRAIKKPSSPACSWIVSIHTAYLHTSFFRVIL